MNNDLPPILTRLKHSLQLLAIPADQQLNLLPDFIVKADEMALDFSNWYEAAVGNFGHGFKPSQIAALKSIDDLLEKMSGEKNAEYWTDEAVRSGNQWAEVRLLAKKALDEFGWRLEEPPSYGHEFVPGS